jgi:hypothetical protein
MSLIICSNNKEDVNLYSRDSLDQAPYRFRNHLTNPVVLPKNSEVAVQSVKINKDSLIPASPTDIFFQYYGERTDTSGEPTSVSRSTSYPIMCSVLDINREKKTRYMNLTEYVDSLTDGMRLGFPHPDADHSNTGTFAEVERAGGHTALEFNAFKLNYGLRDNSGNGAYDPDSPDVIGTALGSSSWKFLTDAETGFDRTMQVELDAGNNDKMKITCLDGSFDGSGNRNVCWLNRDPISHLGGVFEIDLTGLQKGSGDNAESFNGGFAIGLARGTGNDFNEIGYVDHRYGDLSANPHFYDYVVYAEQIGGVGEYYLRVGHSVVNSDDSVYEPSKPIVMDEIIYYDDGDGSAFAGNTLWRAGQLVQSGTKGYNMSRNWAKWDRLRFTLDGEELKIEMLSSVGGAGGNVVADTPYILTQRSDAVSKSGTALNYPKPAGITTWNMCPKVMIRTITRNMTIDKYDGRTMTFKGTTLNNEDSEMNWFVRMIKDGTPRNALEVDTRYMYQMADADNDYVPVPMDEGGTFMENYNFVVILGNGDPFYINTERANMQARLGHSRALLHGSTGESVIYTSDIMPSLMDKGSLFIRLDNFTQKTFNSGTSRPSKILYQVPRFDTSNRENGTALYYEPHQRTYVKLNNTDEIPLNEIHLSLCDNLERLADKGITGQTIICLHFKESDTPLFKTKI